MSNFKDFMDEIENSSAQSLPECDLTLPAIQVALTAAVSGLLLPSLISHNEQQKFSEEVSNLVKEESFLAELSNQIGEPLDPESEDEFVKRGSDALRQLLYDKFGIK
jgi:hypothetical protein